MNNINEILFLQIINTSKYPWYNINKFENK